MVINDKKVIRLLRDFIEALTGIKDAVNYLKHEIKKEGERVMQALEDLKAEVAQVKTDVSAAVDKINALIAQIAILNEGAVTEADLQAITDDLKAAVAPLEAIVAPTT